MSYVLGAVSSSDLYLPSNSEVAVFGQVPSELSEQDFGRVIAGTIAGTVTGNTGIPITADEVIVRMILANSDPVRKGAWTELADGITPTDALANLGKSTVVDKGGNLNNLGANIVSIASQFSTSVTGTIAQIIQPVQEVFGRIASGINKLGLGSVLPPLIDGVKTVLLELGTKLWNAIKDKVGPWLNQLATLASEAASVIGGAIPYVSTAISILLDIVKAIFAALRRFTGYPGLATDYAGDGLNLYLAYLAWSDNTKGTKYLTEEGIHQGRLRGSSLSLSNLIGPNHTWETAYDPIYQEAVFKNSAFPGMFAPARVIDLGPAFVPGWPQFRDIFKDTKFQAWIYDEKGIFQSSSHPWVLYPSVIDGKHTSTRAPGDRSKAQSKQNPPDPNPWRRRDEINYMIGCRAYVCHQGSPLLPYRQANRGASRLLRLAACYVHGTSACAKGMGHWNPPWNASPAKPCGKRPEYFDDSGEYYDLGYGGGRIDDYTARTDWWGYFDKKIKKVFLIPPFAYPVAKFDPEGKNLIVRTRWADGSRADDVSGAACRAEDFNCAIKRAYGKSCQPKLFTGEGCAFGQDSTMWSPRDEFVKTLKAQAASSKIELGKEGNHPWMPQVTPSPTTLPSPSGPVAVLETDRTTARVDPQKARQESARRLAAQNRSLIQSATVTRRLVPSARPLSQGFVNQTKAAEAQAGMSTGKKVLIGVGATVALAALSTGGYLVYRKLRRK